MAHKSSICSNFLGLARIKRITEALERAAALRPQARYPVFSQNAFGPV